LCVCFSSSVSAEYTSSGTPRAGIFYYTPSYNSVWSAPLNTARSEWNNPCCGVSVGSSSDTNGDKLTVASRTDTWYGAAYKWYDTTFKFSIVLNSRTIARDATHFSNFVRSVTVHEIGHIFWLKDNPNTTRASIMKYSRDRNTMVSEQPYDREDVDFIF